MIYCLIFANCVFVDDLCGNPNDDAWETNLQGELAFDKNCLREM